MERSDTLLDQLDITNTSLSSLCLFQASSIPASHALYVINGPKSSKSAKKSQHDILNVGGGPECEQ
jgi:hypothetical protein